MAEERNYQREVRDGNNNLWLEIGKFTDDGKTTTLRWVLMSESFNGIYQVVADNASKQVVGREDSMPGWWKGPLNYLDIVNKYEDGGGEVLKTTLNIVTFVTFMGDGRIQLQRRNFVMNNGLPLKANPGFDSINGGGIKLGETLEQAVIREGREELGVDISGVMDYIGDVYDAEMGRTNHVYRVNGYDNLLIQQHDAAGAVKALINPEGIGRSFMWRADLDAVIEKELLTGISVAILKAFPELYPPEQPVKPQA